MQEEMDQVVTEESEKKGMDSKVWIIIAVVLVVLCCCCVLAGFGGWWLWNNGDELFGLTVEVITGLI
jgi:flagellar basal body-associated protein FliL